MHSYTAPLNDWKHGTGTMFYCVGGPKNSQIAIFLPDGSNPEQRIMYNGLDSQGWTSSKIIKIRNGRGKILVKVLTDHGTDRWLAIDHNLMTISMYSEDYKILYFNLKLVDQASVQ